MTAAITRRIVDALALVGMRVLDHVVVDTNGTASFAEMGTETAADAREEFQPAARGTNGKNPYPSVHLPALVLHCCQRAHGYRTILPRVTTRRTAMRSAAVCFLRPQSTQCLRDSVQLANRCFMRSGVEPRGQSKPKRTAKRLPATALAQLRN